MCKIISIFINLFSVNNILFKYKVHRDTTDTSYIQYNRLTSVSLSNVLYCIYDVSVASRCTLYLNKILFTLN